MNNNLLADKLANHDATLIGNLNVQIAQLQVTIEQLKHENEDLKTQLRMKGQKKSATKK